MNRIVITCPNNYINEREYIINVLIKDFLGVNLQLFFNSKVKDYIIDIGFKKLIIEDHFFNNYSEHATYLTKLGLPKDITLINNKFIKDLPAIYGTDYLSINDNHIILGLDIFASSFFMLTRWEEEVIKKSNNIRCDENELISVKYNFYQKPVVNEYCEYLKILFKKLDYEIPKLKRKTEVFITHDVDRCYLSSKSELLRNLEKMIFQKKLVKKSFTILIRYLYYKISNINPFDSFEELMVLTKKYNFKNHFYFKAINKGEKGYTYNINNNFVKKKLEMIIDNNNFIGFHPSENTVHDDQQFQLELIRLKDASNAKIKGGRNHGLLYFADTFNQWDNSNLQYDSGIGFQFRNGFRSGVCYKYNLFDIYKRRSMRLKEIPMLFMDTVGLRNRMKPEDFLNEANHIFNMVNKHMGIFCMNWHSNLFNSIEMRDYKPLYLTVLKTIANKINVSER